MTDLEVSLLGVGLTGVAFGDMADHPAAGVARAGPADPAPRWPRAARLLVLSAFPRLVGTVGC
jgi:hypothetical protein